MRNVRRGNQLFHRHMTPNHRFGPLIPVNHSDDHRPVSSDDQTYELTS